MLLIRISTGNMFYVFTYNCDLKKQIVIYRISISYHGRVADQLIQYHMVKITFQQKLPNMSKCNWKINKKDC